MKLVLRTAALSFAALLLTGAGAGIGVHWFGSALAAEAPTRNLYAQQLPDLKGQPQRLADLRGKPVVVNFWASWCAPCVEETPMLAALAKQYQPRGIGFIGIGVDSAKNVNAFLAQHPVGYAQYVAGIGGVDLAKQLGDGPGGLPFTVVIDAQGQIRHSKLGRISEAELRSALDALLTR